MFKNAVYFLKIQLNYVIFKNQNIEKKNDFKI